MSVSNYLKKKNIISPIQHLIFTRKVEYGSQGFFNITELVFMVTELKQKWTAKSIYHYHRQAYTVWSHKHTRLTHRDTDARGICLFFSLCLSPCCFQHSGNSWQVSSSGMPSLLFHNTHIQNTQTRIYIKKTLYQSHGIPRPSSYININSTLCRIRVKSLSLYWIIDVLPCPPLAGTFFGSIGSLANSISLSQLRETERVDPQIGRQEGR